MARRPARAENRATAANRSSRREPRRVPAASRGTTRNDKIAATWETSAAPSGPPRTLDSSTLYSPRRGATTVSENAHPTEHSSARGNQHAIYVDLRRGRSRKLPDHAALRDAVLAS